MCELVNAVKIVGICGSLRGSESFTKIALQHVLNGAKSEKSTVELIDLSEYKLHFCDGLDFQSKFMKSTTDAETVDLKKLRTKLQEAHGIILATPEYHNSYSGVLKNAIDLMGFKEFEGKVVGFCSTSGGQMGGLAAIAGLREIVRSLHGWGIYEQACVPVAWKAFDLQTGKCNDEQIAKRLKNVGSEVLKYALLYNNEGAKGFLKHFERAMHNAGAEISQQKNGDK